MSDNIFLVFLHSAGLSQSDFHRLIKKNGDAEIIWENIKALRFPEGIKIEKQEKIKKNLKNIKEDLIYDFIRQKSIILTSIFDNRYFEKFRNINHPPFLYYTRGNSELPQKNIAIVGSRKATNYGQKSLEKIIPELVRNGFGIISGGAYGIDTTAHKISLLAGGYTISLLGTGIDRAYPKENKFLFEEIIEKGGCVFSHFPLGTSPELYNFPIRNELVAGLSDGILVPEASLGSGTFITVQLGLEYGKEVFSIPGDIDKETSKGTNFLIQSGQAKLTLGAEDIFEEFLPQDHIGEKLNNIKTFSEKIIFEDKNQEKIYSLIQGKHQTFDNLCRTGNMEVIELSQILTLLEIGGHIFLDPFGTYKIQENQKNWK